MRKLRQAERTDLSDQRMIDTAMRIILERGVSGLRLTEVGLQAGYSRGLATMRFGTMGGLLKRIAERMSRQWVQQLAQTVGDKVGLAAVYAAIDTQARWLVSLTDHVRVQYLLFFHSMDPGAADRLNVVRVLVAQRRDLARWLHHALKSGQLKAGVDPDAEAGAILSAMIGIIYQSMVDPGVSARKMLMKLKADVESRIATPASRKQRSH